MPRSPSPAPRRQNPTAGNHGGRWDTNEPAVLRSLRQPGVLVALFAIAAYLSGNLPAGDPSIFSADHHPTSSRTLPIAPGDHIAIVGAGPAGIHMAAEMAKAGFHNVTIFEATDEIGGKSASVGETVMPWELDVTHEMGTCYTGPQYYRIRELLHEYGLDETAFVREVLKNSTTGHLESAGTTGEFAAQGGKLKLFAAVRSYSQHHSRLMGIYCGDMPAAAPSDSALVELSTPLGEWLDANGLAALDPIFRVAQTAMGYGQLKTLPLYYGMVWISPTFLSTYIDPSSVGVIRHGGFRDLWLRMARQHSLDVHFNVTITSIDRSDAGVDITFDNDAATTAHFDFLVWTPDMRTARDVLTSTTQLEDDAMTHMTAHTVTTTKYRAPQFDALRDDHTGTVMLADALSDAAVDGVWYADRSALYVAAPEVAERVAKPLRVGYQLWHREVLPPSSKPLRRTVADGTVDTAMLDLLKTSLRGAGINLTDADVESQYVWAPYFPHFTAEGVRKGLPWRMLSNSYRPDKRTWWAGSSVCFESVNAVVAYNRLLLGTSAQTLNPEVLTKQSIVMHTHRAFADDLERGRGSEHSFVDSTHAADSIIDSEANPGNVLFVLLRDAAFALLAPGIALAVHARVAARHGAGPISAQNFVYLFLVYESAAEVVIGFRYSIVTYLIKHLWRREFVVYPSKLATPLIVHAFFAFSWLAVGLAQLTAGLFLSALAGSQPLVQRAHHVIGRCVAPQLLLVMLGTAFYIPFLMPWLDFWAVLVVATMLLAVGKGAAGLYAAFRRDLPRHKDCMAAVFVITAGPGSIRMLAGLLVAFQQDWCFGIPVLGNTVQTHLVGAFLNGSFLAGVLYGGGKLVAAWFILGRLRANATLCDVALLAVVGALVGASYYFLGPSFILTPHCGGLRHADDF